AEDRRARLNANADRLRLALAIAGEGPIVPVLLGDEERAMRVSRRLLERRIFVPAIRPPTVPPGTSRLRVSLRAEHTLDQIDLLAGELQRCIATS
ncbi:MAG: aminotransferase class I/II-fold pyridoxal phosphate-dependent enzyme, partial [Candidatus Cybelea sp.]